MEIFKKEIDGKLHIRIEYTEAEKAEMEAKRKEKLKWKLREKISNLT